MTIDRLDPFGCATFLVVAFTLSGGAQALWLGSDLSRRWAWPLDGRRTFRNRRVFGDNKTARGLVLIPATALAFFMLAMTWRGAGLWPLNPLQYAGLGALAGAGCIVGELPNSFIKRQVGIAPGGAATGPLARPLFFVVDRLDSTMGVVTAVGLAVPIPAATVAWVLLSGVALHFALSVVTFRLGGKARAA